MTFSDALDRHLQSIGKRDVEAFEKTLRPDAQVMGPDGSIIAGREAVMAAHREWFSSTEFTFEPKIEWQCESGDLGIALVRVHYVERKKAPRPFYLPLAFAKNGDRWEMFYDQNTPIGS